MLDIQIIALHATAMGAATLVYLFSRLVAALWGRR